jgi:hypothetical protein
VAAWKVAELRHRHRLDHALVVELADQRRHAVDSAARPACSGAGMNVCPSVCIFTSGREAHRVAEVVDVGALGEAGAGGRLDGDDARLLVLAGELVGGERETRARRSWSRRPRSDDDVGRVVGLGELLLGLEPMIVWCISTWLSTLPSEYFVSSRGRRVLDRLADGDAERAGRVGVLLEHLLADCVSGLGLATTCAPQVSIMMRRYGFCWYETLTM